MHVCIRGSNMRFLPKNIVHYYFLLWLSQVCAPAHDCAVQQWQAGTTMYLWQQESTKLKVMVGLVACCVFFWCDGNVETCMRAYLSAPADPRQGCHPGNWPAAAACVSAIEVRRCGMPLCHFAPACLKARRLHLDSGFLQSSNVAQGRGVSER